jgi:YegS/Rv2252/BmrU family lipid kinase
VLGSTGVAFDLEATKNPGDAAAIAERASGSYDAIVAAGGDGTVHEVVNGLMRAGGKAALGLIPLGSGDDFEKLLTGRPWALRLKEPIQRRLDVGRVSSGADVCYFANGMDIGFGAHGARNVRRVPRSFKRLAAYLGALVLTMIRYPRLEVALTLDEGAREQLGTAMAAVMNGTTFGGSFRVCPEARPDDGLLDVMIVDPVGRLAILQLAAKILRGAHTNDRRVRMGRAKRVRLESAQPLLVEADGEIVFEAAHDLDIEVMPSALRVLS